MKNWIERYRAVMEPVEMRMLMDGTALDATFGAGGVQTESTALDQRLRSVAVQKDGKIISAGFQSDGTGRDFLLQRRLKNGTLDATFGKKGVVVTDLKKLEDIKKVLVLGDGSIVVAGDQQNSSTDTKRHVVLAKYTKKGVLDIKFGTKGVTIFDPVAGAINSAADLEFTKDGKSFLVCGRTRSGGKDRMFMARFAANGKRDAKFKTFLSRAVSDMDVNGMVINTKGFADVLATINLSNSIAEVFEVNTAGKLNSSYGKGGSSKFAFGGQDVTGVDVGMQKNGFLIVCAMTTDKDVILARLKTNGNADTKFANTGVTDLTVNDPTELHSLTVLPNGSIFLAGTALASNNTGKYFAAFMFTKNGFLQNGFATNGFSAVTATFGDDELHAAAVTPLGDMVCVGEQPGNGIDASLEKLLTHGL